MAERRVPRIRFKGFEEDWEQRKLKDIGTLKNGMNFSKEAMGIGFPFVNLQDVFGNTIIDISRLGRAMASPSQLKKYSLLEGDVLFVRSSVKLEGIGEAALVPINLEATTFSGFLIRFRDDYGIDKDFKKFMFKIEKIRNQLISQATDSANKNISQQVIANLDIAVSQKAEQRKVGLFFSTLDSLLSLHQRKLEKLKILKKAMLEKMFPKNGEKVPEIRFSGFADDWEQRKLGEIAEKVSEKNFGMQYSLTLTNSAEFGVIAQRDFFDHDIAKASSLNGYYVVHNEDFVYNPRISVSAPVGPINRNKLGETGVMSPLYTVFRPHDINATYLEYFFKSGYWHKFMNFNGDSGARADRFSIKDQVFFEMPIPFPNPIEQRKIGNYLKRLDSLLSLHQRKLEKLRQIKKSMLERMFV